jgi:hypothetical protein
MGWSATSAVNWFSSRSLLASSCFPLAQRRGGLEVSQVECGFLVLLYLGELPGGADEVGGQLGLGIYLPAVAGQQA